MPWGDAAHARAEQHPRAVPTRQADIETMAALTKVGSTAVWASCNPPARGEHPTLLSLCTADTGERVQEATSTRGVTGLPKLEPLSYLVIKK